MRKPIRQWLTNNLRLTHPPLLLVLVVVILAFGLGVKVSGAQHTHSPDSKDVPGDSPRTELPDSGESPPASVNEEETTDEGNSSFPDVLREFLDEDLDSGRGNGLPIVVTEAVTVDNGDDRSVQISLPNEARLNATGVRRGSAEVVYSSEKDLQIEVATVDGNGTRFVTVIDGPNAPQTYTYGFDVPIGLTLHTNTEYGSALLVANGEDGDTVPVGYIEVPWAYDANGNEVPVSQVITKTSITLTVNHQDAVYPVYADPSYYTLQCTSYSASNSTTNYLRTEGVCPALTFFYDQGYWPVGTRSLANSHRNVERHGECSWYADTGAYWDFQVACKVHDYCYDLIRADHSSVTKRKCDQLFLEDLKKSCNQYKWYDPRRALCHLEVPIVAAGVHWLGSP